MIWGLLILGVGVASFVLWRFLSKRYSLPMPSCLYRMIDVENPFARFARSDFVVSRLGLRPGMVVLDAGCGSGRLTLPLARALSGSIKVTAMDLQRGMVDKVRDKASSEGVKNISYVVAGLGERALPEGRFDRVVLSQVLGEIPMRREAMEEIFRSLRPGGILSVTETVFDPHYQSLSSVVGLARKVGFKAKSRWGDRLAYTCHFEKT
nr:class I SAM-dependent methyltransferase [uncultured Dethiosulfovibrio sp.]